jgi:hypothetical protein
MSNYSLKRFLKSTLRLESNVAHYRLMSIFPPYLHQVAIGLLLSDGSKFPLIFSSCILTSKLYNLESPSFLSVVPVVCYSNADVQKSLVIKENTGKSGVYRWTN